MSHPHPHLFRVLALEATEQSAQIMLRVDLAHAAARDRLDRPSATLLSAWAEGLAQLRQGAPVQPLSVGGLW